MLFASFDFLLFFVVAFSGYWTLSRHRRARLVWTTGCSYFFYMAAAKPTEGPLPTPWYFVGLLLFSSGLDYLCALFIERAKLRENRIDGGSREGKPFYRRPGYAWVLLSLIANLGLLGFFKYSGFLLEVASDAARLLGIGAHLPVLHVLLPVGLSFYTFQSLSYTIDVFRGRLEAERDPLRFGLYVAFFPQLVAGPIVRATEFLPQLSLRPRLTREDVDFAMVRIGLGLFKKVLFADFLAVAFTDRVFETPSQHSSLENLIALYAFTLQIYADFSGYTDIAIGVGRLLGFRLPENFNRPYQAVDIADFWRRWHITLSSWLRDYVYYPLGGSRVGETRSYVNLWVTMFLVGIWHGASWNFVIYASLQATAMVFHRFVSRPASPQARAVRSGLAAVLIGILTTAVVRVLPNSDDAVRLGSIATGCALLVGMLPRPKEVRWLVPLHVLLTFHFSVLSRVFFRADSLSQASAIMEKLVHWDALGVRADLLASVTLSEQIERTGLTVLQPLAQYFVLGVLILGFATHYLPTRLREVWIQGLVPRVPGVILGVSFAALLGGLSLLLVGPRANIYFAF